MLWTYMRLIKPRTSLAGHGAVLNPSFSMLVALADSNTRNFVRDLFHPLR